VIRLLVDGAAVECARYGGDGGDAGRSPVVFLHEGLGSLTQWQGFPGDVCRAAGRAGMAWARAGHGRSQPPARPRALDYMHREATAALPELVERFGFERPVLVGHSDGASIALIAAATEPDRYGAVVAMAPHVFVEDCTVAGIAAAGEAFRAGTLAGRLARHHDDADALFRSWHDAWLAPEFRGWDITAMLDAITVPVLLVQGNADQYGTMAQFDAIEQRVRGPVRRVELAGCGHAPHLEQRDRTTAEVVAFLAGLP